MDFIRSARYQGTKCPSCCPESSTKALTAENSAEEKLAAPYILNCETPTETDLSISFKLFQILKRPYNFFIMIVTMIYCLWHGSNHSVILAPHTANCILQLPRFPILRLQRLFFIAATAAFCRISLSILNRFTPNLQA